MPKEKEWTINSWEDLRLALKTMRPRTKLFGIIRAEMLQRGYWKNAPRGIWAKKKRPSS